MRKETILVDGMTCNHCKAAVEGALTKVDGVSTAEVNLDAKNVTVEFNDNEVTVATLKEEIEEQGYDVQ
ncbi:copper resistance protein CopZ [Salipaludibacillus keqinensis]|uniref:Copper chaperone CopZ n=1 Tax=Salipaludibacillus keqinensis TaxID=2045207 RepID=A0A323THM4_9BACI|nr:copper chaperone CopZ [Salipaludibacillus keqinensis]PYZ93037.1 copper resistance protein CopZ [Salipaludibacillus keqinensis]